MAESTAVLLRRAATLLDELAKAATPGRWEVEYSFDGETLQALWVQVPEGHPDHWDTHDGTVSIGVMDLPADNVWAATVSPVVAAPLAGWLRETAEYIGAVQCSPPAGAVALARALLGDLPDTPETQT